MSSSHSIVDERVDIDFVQRIYKSCKRIGMCVISIEWRKRIAHVMRCVSKAFIILVTIRR